MRISNIEAVLGKTSCEFRADVTLLSFGRVSCELP
jgi:hypothetical protein